MNLDCFIGKVVEREKGIRGKCIGYMSGTRELVVIYGKGGRVCYMSADNAKVVR